MPKRVRSRLLASTSALVLGRQQRRAMRDFALERIDRQINGGPPVPAYVVAWARFV